VPASAEAIASQRSTLVALPVLLPCLALFSSIRVYMPTKDLKTAPARAELRETLGEVSRRFPTGVPLLDPAEDMGVSAMAKI
jgi:ATP-dependent RNA helicase DOB1